MSKLENKHIIYLTGYQIEFLNGLLDTYLYNDTNMQTRAYAYRIKQTLRNYKFREQVLARKKAKSSK